MHPSKFVVQYCVFLMLLVLFVSSVERFAFAQTAAVAESQVLTGDKLQNNPLALKILSEIESFKKHLIQTQHDQNASNPYVEQVVHQREVARQLEQEAINELEQQNAAHAPEVAFASFVSSVNNTAAQNIFWGQFNYMTEKVDAGNVAMKQVLDNGGTWDEAMQEFSKYATITHADMVRINEDLNIQYGAADPSVQSNFDSKGMLPPDYLKVPTNTISP
ncbi:MAG: hypothetical protein KGL95_00730 [Patescibacteria group bacterium]|nr:hypothetical protein [Patescibacteria group bacterium]